VLQHLDYSRLLPCRSALACSNTECAPPSPRVPQLLACARHSRKIHGIACSGRRRPLCPQPRILEAQPSSRSPSHSSPSHSSPSHSSPSHSSPSHSSPSHSSPSHSSPSHSSPSHSSPSHSSNPPHSEPMLGLGLHTDYTLPVTDSEARPPGPIRSGASRTPSPPSLACVPRPHRLRHAASRAGPHAAKMRPLPLRTPAVAPTEGWPSFGCP
jgi:hypothetical protein